MHLSHFLLALLSGTASAGGLKVNYYSDTNCQNYMISIHPFENGACYDYDWTGQQSVGIAECYNSDSPPVWGCNCDFYTGAHCTGSRVSKTFILVNPNWCASNPGGGFKSMKCRKVHGGD